MSASSVPATSKAITRRNRLTAYAFLAPNFLGFLVFTLLPVIFALVLSFHKWDGNNAMEFTGLKNFARLFSDSSFRIAMRNTLVYTVGTVPLIMLFALLLSMLINSGIRGASVFRAFHFFPHISSIIALAAVWQFLYHPTMGPINKFLMSLGVENPPGWLSSNQWALIAVMIMIIWKSIGFYMINYLAGLQAIPRELYEAATVDGASKWRQFWSVTLPSLKPTNFYVAIICVINSFQVFTPIYVMTRGGPGRSTSVLVFAIYKEAFENYNFGYASAMSMVLFVCIFIVTIIQFKVLGQGE